MTRRAWMIIKDFYGKGSDAKVEITSFSWGNSIGGTEVASGPVTGRAGVTEFTVAKSTGETSAKLWERAASGQKFDKVIILIENQVGNDYKPYLNYEITDVYVTAMSQQGSRGKDAPPPTEYVTFKFAKFGLTVTAADDSPNATARPKTDNWAQ